MTPLKVVLDRLRRRGEGGQRAAAIGHSAAAANGIVGERADGLIQSAQVQGRAGGNLHRRSGRQGADVPGAGDRGLAASVQAVDLALAEHAPVDAEVTQLALETGGRGGEQIEVFALRQDRIAAICPRAAGSQRAVDEDRPDPSAHGGGDQVPTAEVEVVQFGADPTAAGGVDFRDELAAVVARIVILVDAAGAQPRGEDAAAAVTIGVHPVGNGVRGIALQRGRGRGLQVAGAKDRLGVLAGDNGRSAIGPRCADGEVRRAGVLEGRGVLPYGPVIKGVVDQRLQGGRRRRGRRLPGCRR